MFKPKYQNFIFKDYSFDEREKKVLLHYSYENGPEFTEEFTLDFEFATNYSQEALERAIFGLFIITGLSYYKAYLAPEIELRKGVLSKGQADFFNKTYLYALGQFLYENNIEPKNLAQFSVTGKLSKSPEISNLKGGLVPFGGGKDSIVTSEMLKNAGVDFDFFSIRYNDLYDKLADQFQKERAKVIRKISPMLFDLNKKDALDGHVSLTSIVSFVALVAAILKGRKDIIFSNESSAEEENLVFHGVKINHQYSKSLEFEKDLQGYIKNFVSPSISYFSILRPLTELKIVEIFTKKGYQDKYRGMFSSCNLGNWKQNSKSKEIIWCRKCPKCAFVFMIFSAFLPKNKLTEIFGGNMYEDPKIDKTFRELLGLEGHKPFECVGEVLEARKAVEIVKEKGEYPELEKLHFPQSNYDYGRFNDHAMSKEYEKILKEFLNEVK